MQQCAAGATHIALNSKADLPTILNFAAWLPTHAGTVASIRLELAGPTAYHQQFHTAWIRQCRAAEEALMLGLRAAAVAAESAAGYRSHVPTAVPVQLLAGIAGTGATAREPPVLRLRSFSCNCLSSPAILQALPAASLTHLEVSLQMLPLLFQQPAQSDMCRPRSCDGAAFARALMSLTGLQHLSVTECNDSTYSSTCSDALIAAAGQLHRLTRLVVRDVTASNSLLLLPPQLQSLELFVTLSSSSSSTLQLGQISALQQLQLHLSGRHSPAAGSSLPPQLAALTIAAAFDSEASDVSSLGVPGLQQLTRLSAANCSLCNAQQLQRLSGHPQLQQLLLTYDDSCQAHAAAAAWQQLPQLCSLSISRERPSKVLTTQESARVSVQRLRTDAAAARQMYDIMVSAGACCSI